MLLNAKMQRPQSHFYLLCVLGASAVKKF